MSITQQDVEKIADLARLDIQSTEILDYCASLNKILDLFQKIEEINTEQVESMCHSLHIQQPIRKDEVTEENQRDYLQKLTTFVEAGLYLVPQVIEEN